MDFVAVLATIILLATVLTLVFAFASYFVSRAKRRRRKETETDFSGEDASPQRTYFERYFPESAAEETASGEEDNRSGQDSQWI